MSELMFENALRASRAYALFESDMRRGQGHTYMIVSPDDDAVESFFKLAGARIFRENGNACFACSECRRVLHKTHADVFELNAERTNLKVAQISALLSSVYVRSLSGKKVYFIQRADLMNDQSQNKLLKTIEEPPEDVTFFLGVANERSMLETVRSRSRKIYIEAFDADVIKREMLALGFDEERSAIAAAGSEGMLGKALKIAKSEDYARLYALALDVLTKLNRSSDVATLDLAIAGDKDKLEDFLDVLSIIVRDMILSKRDPELVASKHIAGKLSELADGFSERALGEIPMLINEARKKLKLNVNALATVDSLLFSILEVKFKWQK